MSFNNILSLSKFEMKSNLANPMSVFTIIIMYPLIFAGARDGMNGEGLKYLLAIFMVMQAMVSTVMHVTIKETTSRENKTIKRLVASPVSKLDYLVSGICTQLLVTIFPIVILMYMSKSVLTVTLVVELGVIFILFFLACYLFGFVISQLVNDAQSAKAIGMIFFITMVYAVNSTNGVLHKVTYLVPINQVADLLKSVLYNVPTDNEYNLLIIFAYILVYGLISMRRFIWE